MANPVHGDSDKADIPGVSGFGSVADGTRGDTQASGKNGLVGGNESTGPVPPGVPGGNGVFGFSTNPNASGVFGANNATSPVKAPGGSGVFGFANAPGAVGVFGANNRTDTGRGVQGNGPEAGVGGFSQHGSGVLAQSDTGPGLLAQTNTGDGVHASTKAPNRNGVVGGNESTGPVPTGVPGGHGIFGFSTNPNASGVFGANNATSPAKAPGGSGVFGFANAPGAVGVFGANNRTDTGRGVQGNGPEAGVGGFSDTDHGVGVLAQSRNIGIKAQGGIWPDDSKGMLRLRAIFVS